MCDSSNRKKHSKLNLKPTCQYTLVNHILVKITNKQPKTGSMFGKRTPVFFVFVLVLQTRFVSINSSRRNTKDKTKPNINRIILVAKIYLVYLIFVIGDPSQCLCTSINFKVFVQNILQSSDNFMLYVHSSIIYESLSFTPNNISLYRQTIFSEIFNSSITSVASRFTQNQFLVFLVASHNKNFDMRVPGFSKIKTLARVPDTILFLLDDCSANISENSGLDYVSVDDWDAHLYLL